MSTSKNRLSLNVILVLYAAVSFSLVIVHDWFIDSRLAGVEEALHEQVMTGNAPAPIQYRVLVYYLADLIHNAGVSIKEAHLAVRYVFTFLAALGFHYLLSMFFVPVASIMGVLYLLAVLPLTYIRYYMQPMDIPNLFFFVAGCALIVKRKDIFLYPLIFVAMLNRETAILLVFVYAFMRFDELPLKDYLLRTAVLFAVGFGTYVLLRQVYDIKHYYADLYYLGFNVSDVRTYMYAAALFGPLAYFAFTGLSSKPKFLRRALLFIPFFVIIHFTMTIMVEPRLWLPVLAVVVASGLWSMLPKDMLLEGPPVGEKANNLVTRAPRLYYVLFLSAFMMFFVVFFTRYKNLHMKDRQVQIRVANMLEEARRFSAVGWNSKTFEELKRAEALLPDSDDVLSALGYFYAYQQRDDAKALKYFKKLVEKNPYHLDRDKLTYEIERLEFNLRGKR
ncbi:MAG: hypothetical protein JW803_00630 [Endomicrobiales bacterium]|nr:hypothetical protein [Endomicrobiales bacterium]